MSLVLFVADIKDALSFPHHSLDGLQGAAIISCLKMVSNSACAVLHCVGQPWGS
jgi:hypothetical protein